MAVSIIDASVSVKNKTSELKAAGVRTVIRYDHTLKPGGKKQLHPDEAKALALADLRLAIVNQSFNNEPKRFSYELGLADARYSRACMEQRGQPDGSAVYFSVDFDASAAELKSQIAAHFEGIAAGMAEDSSRPRARVGVYGSGLSCQTLKAAGLAELCWLAQSKGWRNYAAFKASKQWHLLQGNAAVIAGIDLDPNSANPMLPDFGDFAPAWAEQPSIPTHKVAAAGGLNLRVKPWGTVVTLLPKGQKLRVISAAAGWAEVDVDLDGDRDGFVSARYLAAL
jgi:hypothetical protein